MNFRLTLASIAVLAACKGATGPDTIVLSTDKTIVLADRTDVAAITVAASNVNKSALPTAAKLTLTATAGFFEATNSTTVEVTLDAQGAASANFLCDTDVTVFITGKGTAGASKKLTITCGKGSPTTSTTTGSANLSEIKLSTPTPVVGQSEGVNLTATLKGSDGGPVPDGTDVLFTTTAGSFAGAGSTAAAKTTGSIATATLTAPNAVIGATITAGFTDDRAEAQSDTLDIRVVNANTYTIFLTATSTDLAAVGASSSVVATFYLGTALQVGAPLDVTLLGPSNIGTLVLRTAGGSISSSGLTIDNAVTDANGQIRLDFVSGVSSGAAQITFVFSPPSGEDVAESITVNVSRPPGLAHALFSDIDNRIIRVKGSINPNVAKVVFKFTDEFGNDAPDGITVNFSLSPNHSQDVYLSPAVAVTEAGFASTYLNAGGQAETVTVTARAVSNGVTALATTPSIAIVGGIPAWDRLSISCDPAARTSPGLSFDGYEVPCTLQLADRFSDRVDVGTQVSFRVEAGNVQNTLPVDPASGKVLPVVYTADPRPRKFLVLYQGATQAQPYGDQVPPKVMNIRELLPPKTYSQKPRRPLPDGTERIYLMATNTRAAGAANDVTPFFNGETDPLKQHLTISRALIGSRASVRLIAITQGEEAFVDANGNKAYDQGEAFVDLPEPFIDKNDNGVRDDCTEFDATLNRRVPFKAANPPLTLHDALECTEDFIDLNGDGKWNQGNNQWDNYTAIWKTTVLTWLGDIALDMYPLVMSAPYPGQVTIHPTNGAPVVADDMSAKLYEWNGQAAAAYPDDVDFDPTDGVANEPFTSLSFCTEGDGPAGPIAGATWGSVCPTGYDPDNLAGPGNYVLDPDTSVGHKFGAVDYLITAADENWNCDLVGDALEGVTVISGTNVSGSIDTAAPNNNKYGCDFVVNLLDNGSLRFFVDGPSSKTSTVTLEVTTKPLIDFAPITQKVSASWSIFRTPPP